MSKVAIYKKDGTATRYVWMSTDTADQSSVTVYKKTADGVKRMSGVRFNPITNRMRRL